MKHKFGMFVHWGIYALSGWHEQYRWRMSVGRGEYAEFAGRFTPYLYDPEKWVLLAKNAGMEYICFTAKHHDGFCMWDTDCTSFKITNTPYGRDTLKMLADACRKHNMALSIYYSIPDWNHPNAYNPLSTHQVPPEDGDVPDADAYKAYVKKQITELLTRYGEIYTLFWDIPPHIYDPSLNDYVRTLQPEILINDRGYGEGDFSTPERTVSDGDRFESPTEACQSVGKQSWGYRENEDYYSVKFLEQSITKIMLMGGSYLLNVGPDALGRIPERSVDMISKIGGWYNRVCEAFGSEPVKEFSAGEFLASKRGNTYYFSFIRDPICSGVSLAPSERLPKSAVILNDPAKRPVGVWKTSYPSDFDSVGLKLSPPQVRLYSIPVDEFGGEPIIIKAEY